MFVNDDILDTWEMGMPQLTRPIPRRVTGPSRTTPFRIGQEVLVSNEFVILKAKIDDPQCNLHCEELIRQTVWGCKVTIPDQPGLDAFCNDLSLYTFPTLILSHSKGLWKGNLMSSMRANRDLMLTIVGE